MKTFKCVAISDTHNRMNKVVIPPCDFLFHAGDGTGMGSWEESERWMDEVAKAPARHKIFIAGNHDWSAQKDGECFSSMAADRGLAYCQDGGYEIEGLRFYGSPWQPWFCDWAFNLERGEDIAERWRLIPEGLHVLLTHGPPEGILDKPYGRGGGVGCKDLLDKVLEVKPKHHIFGHIHGSYGEKFFEGIHFINASTCDEWYSPSNKPVEFEVVVDDA